MAEMRKGTCKTFKTANGGTGKVCRLQNGKVRFAKGKGGGGVAKSTRKGGVAKAGKMKVGTCRTYTVGGKRRKVCKLRNGKIKSNQPLSFSVGK